MKLITSLILIVPWLEHTDSRSVSKYIAVVGDTVTLNCPEKSQNSVTWHGPQNYMPYSENAQLNPALISKNIIMVGNHSKGEYNLEILNVTYANQGNYRCRVLNSRAKEYGILLIIKDIPSTVKEITAKDLPKETHMVTNFPGKAVETTKAQNENSYNNLNVSFQNKGCTDSTDNTFNFIIVCIASFVVVLVVVTFLGIVLSKYYKTKYRKQNVSEVEITNDYEEIESTNSDFIQDARIIINPRLERNIPVTGIGDSARPLDTTINERNDSKYLTPSLSDESEHTTQGHSAIDLTTEYENDTFICYSDDEDQDAYLHPYVELGPEDYLNPYQSLQLQQSNTEK
ncbi:unnamed protein product [Mytilus coruscus]|uniref:Ig-like domain-containing protein n=1 Tax=Mytilus coruscus TaxID=42192 RepID=A0A6J8BIY0_MYTCO|nr:unnamed protein product [Mytilus coruscus]